MFFQCIIVNYKHIKNNSNELVKISHTSRECLKYKYLEILRTVKYIFLSLNSYCKIKLLQMQ